GFPDIRPRAIGPAHCNVARPQPGGICDPHRAASQEEVGLMPGPLHGLRVVTTMPPHTWFGGVDYNFAVEMSEELRALGAEFFDLDVAGFHSGNQNYINGAIEALKVFRPDVALPLPNALYALLCVTRDGKNILRDIL